MNSPVSKTGFDWPLVLWLAVVGSLGYLVYSAEDVLTPFLLGAIFAYIAAPVVDYLVTKGLGRTLATSLVVVVIMFICLVVPLIFLPLLVTQLIEAATLLPAAFAKAWETLTEYLPWDQESGLEKVIQEIKEFDFSAALPQAGNLVMFAVNKVADLFTLLFTLILTPLVTFFLLRDWPKLVGNVGNHLPAKIRPTVTNIAVIADNALGEFLRGQGSVMLIMMIIYSILLLLANTPFALAIGFVAGLLCFIPFVGFLISLLLALIVSFIDFASWWQILYTVVALGVGTSIESFVVTPKIIGERIGLGPVAVLFSLSVLGAAFGFAGILLALPIAAVGLALWRHYLQPEAADAV